MICGKRVLAFVPARGGSKAIKWKNIADVCGKPLVAYSIEAAAGCKYVDDVIVSTDSEEIAAAAIKYGAWVPFMRPARLAGDTAAIIDAALYTVENLKKIGKNYDIFILLQPTQPLRMSEDIDGALETFLECGQEGLVSVCPVEEHPILMRTIDGEGRLRPVLNQGSTVRRQDMPIYYKVNGCIYINRIDELTGETSFNDNPVPYLMGRERSADIDSYEDLEEVRKRIGTDGRKR